MCPSVCEGHLSVCLSVYFVCLSVRHVYLYSEQKDDPDEVKLKAEMQQYGDIVRIDMVDTYADLSMKTLRMFSVLPQKIDADFYFKIDDDVAVNVDALADYLDARRTQGNLYLVGSCQRSDICFHALFSALLRIIPSCLCWLLHRLICLFCP